MSGSDGDSWAIYRDDHGYTAYPNKGLAIDLGGRVIARRLKAFLTPSLARRLAEKYNRQMKERRKREQGTI